MAYQIGQIATNKNTGEKRVYTENGWQPMPTAAPAASKPEFSATSGMSNLDAALVGAGRTFMQIGEHSGPHRHW